MIISYEEGGDSEASPRWVLGYHEQWHYIVDSNIVKWEAKCGKILDVNKHKTVVYRRNLFDSALCPECGLKEIKRL